MGWKFLRIFDQAVVAEVILKAHCSFAVLGSESLCQFLSYHDAWMIDQLHITSILDVTAQPAICAARSWWNLLLFCKQQIRLDHRSKSK